MYYILSNPGGLCIQVECVHIIKSRWAVPERLLYCPVFKAASTSWLVNFLKLSNRFLNLSITIAVSLNSHVDLRLIPLKKNLFRTMNINPKKGNLHKKSVNLFPAPATFKLRRKIFEESTKFIVVRNLWILKSFLG